MYVTRFPPKFLADVSIQYSASIPSQLLQLFLLKKCLLRSIQQNNCPYDRFPDRSQLNQRWSVTLRERGSKRTFLFIWTSANFPNFYVGNKGEGFKNDISGLSAPPTGTRKCRRGRRRMEVRKEQTGKGERKRANKFRAPSGKREGGEWRPI